MLIQKLVSPGDVVTIKTVVGDELMATLDQVEPEHIKVSKPMAIVASGQGLGLAPYAFTITQDAKIDMYKHSIVFYCKSDIEMEKQYIQTTTGISV